MKRGWRVALTGAVVASACARGTAPRPASPQPVSALASTPPPATPAPEPPATAAEPEATPDAGTDAGTDPCEAAELDLDALFESRRCPLHESPDTAETDPAVTARIDATDLEVAPGGTVRVPVVFDNATSRTLPLVLRGCAHQGADVGAGLLGQADASTPTVSALSLAFGTSVENGAGKRVDQAKGDDIGCLSACSPLGLAVRLPPGAHAKATLEYRALMHRWIQCEDQRAGPLRAGTYELVLSGGAALHATTKLVVRKR